jgi:hypothetical protein
VCYLISCLVSSTAAQASSARHHVHFDVPSTSAALGGSPGPSGQRFEEDPFTEDPFMALTHAQPSTGNQVSIYYIIFYNNLLTNLIQGGSISTQTENFDLPRGSDGSQEGDTGPDAPLAPDPCPSTPTHRTRAPKAGSRLANSGDDTIRFFQEVEGKRQCKFCL